MGRGDSSGKQMSLEISSKGHKVGGVRAENLQVDSKVMGESSIGRVRSFL